MRWRLRMAIRGAGIILGAGFVAFLLSAYGLEAARFSPGAVTALRLVAWGSVVGASDVAWASVAPACRRATPRW